MISVHLRVFIYCMRDSLKALSVWHKRASESTHVTNMNGFCIFEKTQWRKVIDLRKYLKKSCLCQTQKPRVHMWPICMGFAYLKSNWFFKYLKYLKNHIEEKLSVCDTKDQPRVHMWLIWMDFAYLVWDATSCAGKTFLTTNFFNFSTSFNTHLELW